MIILKAVLKNLDKGQNQKIIVAMKILLLKKKILEIIILIQMKINKIKIHGHNLK
jgi:hypothetical protein